LRFRVGIFQLGFWVSATTGSTERPGSCGFGAPPRTHSDRLKKRAAFRAGDWGLIEVIKLRTAIGAQTLRSKLWFGHGF
jgi:hypothetical protein